MTADDWPQNWPDLRNVPYADWPDPIRAIDEEMKALIRIKIVDQVPEAVQRLRDVLAVQGKSMDDLYALIIAWKNPYWNVPLQLMGELTHKDMRAWLELRDESEVPEA